MVKRMLMLMFMLHILDQLCGRTTKGAPPINGIHTTGDGLLYRLSAGGAGAQATTTTIVGTLGGQASTGAAGARRPTVAEDLASLDEGPHAIGATMDAATRGLTSLDRAIKVPGWTLRYGTNNTVVRTNRQWSHTVQL